MKRFLIIDYKMGNLKSVANAFEFLGCKTIISGDKKEIVRHDALILPGVGAFNEAMNMLKSKDLIKTINHEALVNKKPFLGICLGMQLMADSSEENGYHKGLGWIPGKVLKIPVSRLRLPHIGWNNISVIKDKPLFTGIKDDFNFYFVHSFYLSCRQEYISSYFNYGKNKITASVQKDNIFATQFHPEKSQENGLRVLRNFINYVNGAV